MQAEKRHPIEYKPYMQFNSDAQLCTINCSAGARQECPAPFRRQHWDSIWELCFWWCSEGFLAIPEGQKRALKISYWTYNSQAHFQSGSNMFCENLKKLKGDLGLLELQRATAFGWLFFFHNFFIHHEKNRMEVIVMNSQLCSAILTKYHEYSCIQPFPPSAFPS